MSQRQSIKRNVMFSYKTPVFSYPIPVTTDDCVRQRNHCELDACNKFPELSTGYIP